MAEATVLKPRSPPTSRRGLFSNAKFVGGTTWTVVLIAIALGLFLALLPLVGRVPVLGKLVKQGAGVFTGGASNGATTDEFGTTMG